ncbi:MAG: class I SAM-dependent methyltransferase [Methanolobus sp.]|uniref:class I SAM-dependent methyltransferase n=1 Tax=Methanolobus sp. TaxID=1874737 RepID=UPI002731DA96|nr:class I SAM-dependent methyltransferase [Methanolobus sp.]MDP2218431.1 class I SAM-dependent methyltransferase [Methanolobus sp.]
MNESPFDIYADKYDMWYEEHYAVYESELEAIRELLPAVITGKSLEIGAGTGRFASALGISYGLDPSGKMLRMAGKRGVGPIRGVAEHLPLKSSSIGLVLIVTSLCFMDTERTLSEIYRVLVPGGELVVAFIERKSSLGTKYHSESSESDFYRKATFHSASELIEVLREQGFHGPATRQTLFKPLSEIKVSENPEKGCGKGSFVVIRTTSIKKK